MDVPLKKTEEKRKFKMPSCGEILAGVREFFWESDCDKDDLPFRPAARLVKIVLPVYMVCSHRFPLVFVDVA